MAEKYKLFCEYVHCCGKRILELGDAQTEDSAKKWCNEQTKMKKRPRLPENDLIRICPVRSCPAKLQLPRYGYRGEHQSASAAAGEEIGGLQR